MWPQNEGIIVVTQKQILVSQSLAVDKRGVNPGTLMTTLFYDLVNEKDFKIPTQPEKRKRKLIEVIAKRRKRGGDAEAAVA